MTDRSNHPIVHFVGSIPLPDSETVFRTLSKAVGPHLVRLHGLHRQQRRRQQAEQHNNTRHGGAAGGFSTMTRYAAKRD